MLRIIVFAFAAAAAIVAGRAEKRALGVGVNAYDNLPAEQRLRKAVNDSRAVGKTFEQLGFKVEKAGSVDRRSFNEAWPQFVSRLEPRDAPKPKREWESVDKNSVVMLEIFLTHYGSSRYAKYARGRIDELKKQVELITPPPPGGKPAQPVVGASGPPVGETFRDCSDCPEMVVVPAGSFTMGSPANEPERGRNEGPQHRVTIAQPFAVGKYAVTFAEWDACFADGGCGDYKVPDHDEWGRGDRPVINVNWEHAQAYVKWLSKKTGKTYRLPSEAEREYFARAGTDTPFWWGSSITPDQANYDGNAVYEGGGSKGEFRQQTVPVKSFKHNKWGLYQVRGNVWEWTQDCWNDNYNDAPADGSARATGDCRKRVARGGSWSDFPWDLRAACRKKVAAGYRYDDQGFRVVRTLE